MSIVVRPDQRANLGLVETWRARGLVADAVATMAIVGAMLIAAVSALYLVLGFGWAFVSFALIGYAFACGLVFFYLEHYPHPRFGAANAITAFRLGMTCLVGGLLFEAGRLSEPAMEAWLWTFVAASAFALSLDGFDGWLARRNGQCSNFGARFDMEVDATLILFLSIMAFALDKAGMWVVLIGAMRHIFLLGRLIFPRLQGDLEESFRRKTICVLQIAALCIILTPIVQPPYSTAIAGLALVSLVYSFSVDIYALLRGQVVAA